VQRLDLESMFYSLFDVTGTLVLVEVHVTITFVNEGDEERSTTHESLKISSCWKDPGGRKYLMLRIEDWMSGDILDIHYHLSRAGRKSVLSSVLVLRPRGL